MDRNGRAAESRQCQGTVDDVRGPVGSSGLEGVWGDYYYALAFSGPQVALSLNEHLQEITEDEEVLFGLILEHLGLSYRLVGKGFLDFDHSLSEEWRKIFARVASFKSNYDRFCTLMPQLSLLECPYYPLAYDFQGNVSLQSCDGVPLIFMEAYDCSWKDFCDVLRGRSAVFVFYDVMTLIHCLQFDELLDSFVDDKHDLCIFGHYTHIERQEFSPVMISRNPLLIENQRVLVENMSDPDRLYALGKKINFAIVAERVGRRHFLDWYSWYLYQQWHDKHKSDIDLGPKTSFYMQRYLDETEVTKKTKFSRGCYPLKVAHVMGRLCDTFAVSKRVVELLEHYDTDRFDVHLFTTECLKVITSQSFFFPFEDKSSVEAAPRLLERLGRGDITVHLGGGIQEIAEGLEDFDIVVFHDINVFNLLLGRMLSGVFRIFMEHGHLPAVRGCFDLVVVSHEEEIVNNQLLANYLDIPFVANPCGIPIEEFSSLSKILPEGSFKLTTSSLCLEGRLSEEMCDAVAEILRRCPRAYYLPIGPLVDLEKQRQRFERRGVGERVIFLGRQEHFIKDMDLYLNEFPCGSGITILEAMAAGCPIVAMYDRGGSVQGRHGGNYFGVDYTAKSYKEYVELACWLINDERVYAEWSRHALECYAQRADVGAYVRRHEQIIVEHYERFAGKFCHTISAG